MKKILLFVVALLVSCSSLSAQVYKAVDTVWRKYTYPEQYHYGAFVNNATLLATSSTGRVHIFNAQTGEETFTQDLGDVKAHAAINGKDYLFISTGDTLIQWDVETKERTAIYTDTLLRNSQGQKTGKFIESVSVLPLVNRIAVGFITRSTSSQDKHIIIVHTYPIGSNTILKTVSNNTTSDLLNVRFSPDGKYLAVARNIAGEYSITLFNTETWSYGSKDVFTLGGQDQYLNSMEFSHDSKLLATTFTTNNTIKIWDIEKRMLLKTYSPNLHSPERLKFLSNTKFAVANMYDVGMFDTRVDTAITIWSLPHGNHDIDFDTVAHRVAVSSGQGVLVFRDNAPSSVQPQSVENINEVFFPNPTDGMVTLGAIERKYTSFQILDNTGKVVSEGVLSSNAENLNDVRFNTSMLSQGIYFIQLRSGKETKTLKLIKGQ
ncbi:MAG: T9SS type A sorting domain-containing protein [Candidatus Kapaibacterium sp.]